MAKVPIMNYSRPCNVALTVNCRTGKTTCSGNAVYAHATKEHLYKFP